MFKLSSHWLCDFTLLHLAVFLSRCTRKYKRFAKLLMCISCFSKFYNRDKHEIDLLFSTWASEYNVHLTCLLLIWQACLKIDTKLPSQCQEQTVVKTKKTWLGKRLSVWENLWSLLKEYAHDEARFKTIGHNSIQSLYSRREGDITRDNSSRFDRKTTIKKQYAFHF